jgi:hypothetical protein
MGFISHYIWQNSPAPTVPFISALWEQGPASVHECNFWSLFLCLSRWAFVSWRGLSETGTLGCVWGEFVIRIWSEKTFPDGRAIAWSTWRLPVLVVRVIWNIKKVLRFVAALICMDISPAFPSVSSHSQQSTLRTPFCSMSVAEEELAWRLTLKIAGGRLCSPYLNVLGIFCT